MQIKSVGDISIQTVIEELAPMGPPLDNFAEATPEALAPHIDWMTPAAYDPATREFAAMPTQSYVLKTPAHTILIDTCTGNHKRHEPVWPQWHMRTDFTWLEDLIKAGVDPESIDYVFCTHMHVDHVGWNTKLVDGRWVPTFPNARYLFAKKELEWSQAQVKSQDWTFEDSVQPILEAGLAEIVESDFALNDQIWLEPQPGHTPGHVAVRMRSRDETAVMSGDLIHHPIQLAHPDWSPVYDDDPDLARITRRRFLEDQADKDILMMTAHFPLPSVGHVISKGDAFGFRYADDVGTVHGF